MERKQAHLLSLNEVLAEHHGAPANFMRSVET